jgi:hypothetical protein
MYSNELVGNILLTNIPTARFTNWWMQGSKPQFPLFDCTLCQTSQHQHSPITYNHHLVQYVTIYLSHHIIGRECPSHSYLTDLILLCVFLTIYVLFIYTASGPVHIRMWIQLTYWKSTTTQLNAHQWTTYHLQVIDFILYFNCNCV